MAYFVANALREDDFYECRFLSYDIWYDVFQEKTFLFHFEGTLQRSDLMSFVHAVKQKIDVTGIRYSTLQSYTNENNSVTLVLKLHDKSPKFIPEGAKPYTHPPSRAKRSRQRQQEYFARKNYEKKTTVVSPQSAHPGLGSGENSTSNLSEPSRQSPALYISSDSDAILSAKSSGCFSRESFIKERKTQRNRRRRVKVSDAECQTPPTPKVETRSTTVETLSCTMRSRSTQTRALGESLTPTPAIVIDKKAVQREIDLIKWHQVSPAILKNFVCYLRSNDSLQSKIPAFVAFLFCTGGNAEDVENVLRHITQDVDIEVLISLLALSVNV